MGYMYKVDKNYFLVTMNTENRNSPVNKDNNTVLTKVMR